MSMTYAGQPRPTLMRRASLLVAATFGIVGVAGFVPGLTTNLDQLQFAGHDSGAQLLGLFDVSVLHNLVHLAFAIAGFALARTDHGPRRFLIGGGIVYLLLALYGIFVDRHDSGNFVPLDTADNWLHLGLGIAMIATAYIIGARDRIEPEEPAKSAPGPSDDEAARSSTSDARGNIDDHDRLADEMSEESFPTSDPPSTWAGSDTPGR